MKKKITAIVCVCLLLVLTLSCVQAAENPVLYTEHVEVDDKGANQEQGNEAEDEENETDESEVSNKETENAPDINDAEISTKPEEVMEDAEVSFEEEEAYEQSEDEDIVLTDDEGEELFSAGSDQISVYGASSIPVDWVDANYKMREEYAFTYAFRKNVTELSYISRQNSGLNAKIHNWFGDGLGYTEEYCKTFYACAIDADTNTDPITAIYSNVGEYQGEIVDLRVTVPKWGSVNKDHVGKDGKKITPCVMFYKNRIAFNTVSVGIVRFKFEFLKHGTDEQVYPKGHITAADLDGGQGIRVYDYWGIDHIYLRKGYDYLKATEGTTTNGNGYREIKSSEGSSSLSNGDVQGWCHLDFNGSFTLNWLAQDSWKNSKGVQNAFYVSTGQTVGIYEPNPQPEKRVGDVGEAYEAMSRHEFIESDPPYDIIDGKEFDYVIKQKLLPGTYESFVVEDRLDKCIKYRGASVVTSLGNDVTDQFEITEQDNKVVFSANSDFLQRDEAYNDVIYYFRINVQAGSMQEIDADDHYRRSKEFYSIVNTASRTIVSNKMRDEQNTNESWVKGTTVFLDGEITVTKKIKETDITWAHGNPVFRFRITGKDEKGISHVYENYVEFEKEKYNVSGKDAVLTCSFKGVQAGRYTISELPTLRYKFESVSADTENASVSGKTAIVSIDSRHKEAAVTFRNKKTRYDRYSHTDVVRNIIPITGE